MSYSKTFKQAEKHLVDATKAVLHKDCESAVRHVSLANRFLGVLSTSASKQALGVKSDYRKLVDDANRTGRIVAKSCKR